jgi:hypothetical protein
MSLASTSSFRMVWETIHGKNIDRESAKTTRDRDELGYRKGIYMALYKYTLSSISYRKRTNTQRSVYKFWFLELSIEEQKKLLYNFTMDNSLLLDCFIVGFISKELFEYITSFMTVSEKEELVGKRFHLKRRNILLWRYAVNKQTKHSQKWKKW